MTFFFHHRCSFFPIIDGLFFPTIDAPHHSEITSENFKITSAKEIYIHKKSGCNQLVDIESENSFLQVEVWPTAYDMKTMVSSLCHGEALPRTDHGRLAAKPTCVLRDGTQG
jgi:hypothetical protein